MTKKKLILRVITPYLLMLPLCVFLAIFLMGIFNVMVQSLGYLPSFGLDNLTLDYYKEVFRDPMLFSSVRFSLYVSLVSSAIATVIGVLITAALIHTDKTENIMLQIVRAPIVVPHTIVALFAITMLSQSGLISRLMYSADIISEPGDFPNLVFDSGGISIILAYVWKEAPFIAYFVFSLMSSVKASLSEAAATLGASPVRSFFTITLPLSMPAIGTGFIIISAFSFGAYELPYLLGSTLPKALPVQAYIEYAHPDLLHRPYAMAMNGIMLITTLLMSVLFFILLNNMIKKAGTTHTMEGSMRFI